ncbi:MAG: Aldehyde dehydrogenase [Tenericutes bacterium ADurb.Bin239]|nr:MAG: Aldehyde dehydrogenase [Tenericutes bacterium ADurb.Bin239]
MLKIIQAQKEAMQKTYPLGYEKRKELLLSLQKAIKVYEKDIYDALYADLHKDEWEVFVTELGIVYDELHFAIKNLKRWMRKKRIKTPLVQFPGKNFIIPEPFGQVLIMSPWNYPLQLTFLPLIGAIAAGNYAVIKPSAYAPEIAKVMKQIVETAFPNQEAILFLGGRQVNEEILKGVYDFIFFTGSPGVGKIVMNKASENLTPIVLELGGKSPFIITEDADIPLTIRRLKFAKLINSGQTCVAPDYVLLDKKLVDKVEDIKKAFTVVGDEATRLPKIINEKHYLRLKGILEEVGSKNFDDKTQTIRPTVLLNPPLNSEVMQEEIFGPILPIITYDTLDEAIKFVTSRPKPLALYVFTKSKETMNKVLTKTTSGSAAINDAVVQLANPHFPFGGVGNSGMGSYHGYHTFKTFSHQKAVLHKSRFLDFRFRYKPGPKTVGIFKLLGRNK